MAGALVVGALLVGVAVMTTTGPNGDDRGATPAGGDAAAPAGDDAAAPAGDDTAAGAGPTSEASEEAVTPVSLPPLTSTALLETVDLDPANPLPWHPDGWDVTVHSRDPETWDELDPVDADHGPNCEAPPASHPVTAYDDAVYACRDHLMTAIRGDAYALVYLTPDHLVDFSEGTAVISFDISTLRTSTRDWWDVWITPWDDALQLPLDLDASADLSGPPRRAIRVGLGTENQIQAEIYDDFYNVEFPDWPYGSVTGDSFTGYETFLEPDAMRRDTFEIHLSSTHLKVGMPAYDFWWIDTDIPELDWSSGVVQFGHHSYNPVKDCNIANNPRPPVDECLPTTWHWDNFAIAPAIQFHMIDATERSFDDDHDTATLAAPAPAGALLRFAGIGLDPQVSFDGGPWIDAVVRPAAFEAPDEHFASYVLAIPEGTVSVRFAADDWYAGPWHVRDVSVWARGDS